ncbi:MAG: DUF2625 domain-containing protein [Propionibacteriaceae bacterium]|nr:DUF2625 domain-containing protein [Propionibacteriaceae bacterium]
MSRSIEELMNVDDPFTPDFVHRVATAKNDILVLPSEPATGREVLHRLQVSARSSASGTILSGGGMVVDHGWIRVFGAGTPLLPDMATASGFPLEPGEEPPAVPGLFLAIDVLGGQFAIDSGLLAGSPGELCYWAPDDLQWTPFGLGQAQFLTWLCEGDLDGFYSDYRWDGWQDEVEALPLDQGISFFPFAFTKEFDLATATRSVTPIAELVSLHTQMAESTNALSLPLPWPALPA